MVFTDGCFSSSLILAAWVALSLRGAKAQTSASFQFPVEPASDFNVNYIDTIVLQWTSNFPSPLMYMWCQNGSGVLGNNVVLASQFNVKNSGTLGYVLQQDFPEENSFPIACHAQLVPSANGPGVDSPVGITFTSQPNVVAKTISLSSSQAQATSATPPPAAVTSTGTETTVTGGASTKAGGETTAKTSAASGSSTSAKGTGTETSIQPVVTLTNGNSSTGASGQTSPSGRGDSSKAGKSKRKTWWSMSGIEVTDRYNVHEVDGVNTAKHEVLGTTPHWEKEASLKRMPVELP